MVLNNAGIIDALNQGEIEIIKYTWDNTNVTLSKYDPLELKEGHKIRLHVGFLVRTLSDKRWLNPKVLYNKRDGIVDLRKLEERKYALQPKESIILFTNESIRLGPNYFGLLLSRVSLEETGLIVSPSYIDPNWNGVLQLVVTNNSETPKLIQEYCEISNLILFKMEQRADVTIQKRNDHYGVTWEMISSNPIFPKWQDRKRSVRLKIRHMIRTYWIVFTGIGLVGAVAIIYQIISLLLNFIKLLVK